MTNDKKGSNEPKGIPENHQRNGEQRAKVINLELLETEYS